MSRRALHHQSSGTISYRHLLVRILRRCVCARARSTGRRPVLSQTRLLRQAPLENWGLAIGINMRSRHVRDRCGWSASRTPGSAAGFPKPHTAEPQRPKNRRDRRPHLEIVLRTFLRSADKGGHPAASTRRRRRQSGANGHFNRRLGSLPGWVGELDGAV